MSPSKGVYAKDTSVSVEKSRTEIERTLTRYGADAFSYGWSSNAAAITFRISSKFYRIEFSLPPQPDGRHRRLRS